jgi:hypothetical protein
LVSVAAKWDEYWIAKHGLMLPDLPDRSSCRWEGREASLSSFNKELSC